MIGFPPAKINLGLSVLSRRSDGFHNLETVFYPVRLRDILEIIPASGNTLRISGLPVPGDPKDNLLWRAYKLLKSGFPQIPPVEIQLFKSIPSGAGLGGGSSDAACMLNLLNTCFDLNIPGEKLASYALSLGSDCPFFLNPSPSFARGRGEILEPVSLDLSGYSILLVHPGKPVSTAWAYSRIRPAGATFSIKELMAEPPANCRDRLQNDFEIPVFQQYPELQKIKTALYEAGALYASLSGSGSSLFGIFKKTQVPPNIISAELQQSFLS
ncbi:MAG TPA: 4-(cytidine 5'-diphospho)-2-C-methyl-D-erythritol kinase [Puia sp.]